MSLHAWQANYMAKKATEQNEKTQMMIFALTKALSDYLDGQTEILISIEDNLKNIKRLLEKEEKP